MPEQLASRSGSEHPLARAGRQAPTLVSAEAALAIRIHAGSARARVGASHARCLPIAVGGALSQALEAHLQQASCLASHFHAVLEALLSLRAPIGTLVAFGPRAIRLPSALLGICRGRREQHGQDRGNRSDVSHLFAPSQRCLFPGTAADPSNPPIRLRSRTPSRNLRPRGITSSSTHSRADA
jgi:hypothetical protein